MPFDCLFSLCWNPLQLSQVHPAHILYPVAINSYYSSNVPESIVYGSDQSCYDNSWGKYYCAAVLLQYYSIGAIFCPGQFTPRGYSSETTVLLSNNVYPSWFKLIAPNCVRH